MKKIFKVFGLQEIDLVTSVSLHGSIDTEKEMCVVRVHQGNFDTELDAMKFVDSECGGFEHGFEIVEVFVSK